MSKKNTLSGLVVFLTLILVIAVFAKTVSAETINITAATGGGTKGFLYLTLKAAADRIEKKSNGRVKFTFYTHGTLLKYRGTYRGVVDGVADISNVIVGIHAGQFPKSGVLELTPGYASGVKNGKDNAYLTKNYLMDEWKDVKVLYASGVPGNNLITAKKPVRSMADLKGMRIRASGPGARVVKAWGAVQVSLSTGEMYEALQKGIVDGVLTNEAAFVSLKFSDVCRYSNQIYATQNAGMTVMNRKKYDSLPDDIKKLFDELMDWAPEVAGDISGGLSKKGVEALLAAGGETISYSPRAYAEFIDALKDINNQWAADMEKKGLPGKMLLEARNKLLRTK